MHKFHILIKKKINYKMYTPKHLYIIYKYYIIFTLITQNKLNITNIIKV